ncbi:MAG: hypothetical protein J0I26_04350 [Alphaproteobacteria bacterium]|nr:hypothetical protein [Alphaproteobacteria bacterium]
MAYYKYANFLSQQQGTEFDVIHPPATATPFSGIYRCTGCGLSVTSVYEHHLPPQNHHQHANYLVPIRWQLTVKSHYRQ